MNIIKRELYANLKGFLIWVISLSLLFFAASAEYEVFAANPDIQDFMDDFGWMFELLGAGNIDITSPVGYVSLVSFYIYLPLGIYSALLGSTIISKEEKDKTAEYLFTLPVTRKKVLASKLFVSLFYSILINIIVMIVVFLAFGRFGYTDAFPIFVFNLSIGVLTIQIIFLSIGLLLSSILKQYKKSGSITIGILISTFMLSMLSNLSEKADFLKYFTPFQYFTSEDMEAGDFQLVFILLSVIIIASGISGLFYFYRKRDLYI